MGGMIPMPDEIVGELAYLRRVHTMKHARNRALDTALES
jgi:hypothetical protein